MIDPLTDIRAVVVRHPALTPGGFSNEQALPAAMLTPDVLDQFTRSVAWLSTAPRTCRYLIGSYWASCIAGRLTGTYISNGAIIAAADHLGIKMRRNGVNADLAISLPWIRREDGRSAWVTLARGDEETWWRVLVEDFDRMVARRLSRGAREIRQPTAHFFPSSARRATRSRRLPEARTKPKTRQPVA